MIAAAASSAAQLLGGGLNALYSSMSQRQQYKYNLKLQQQAQQWQEYMSNTAHQREVTDLRAAGLNPVLSANGGASTGSVGATSVGMPSALVDFRFGDNIIEGLNSSIKAKQVENERELREKEIETAKKRLELDNDLGQVELAQREVNLANSSVDVAIKHAQLDNLLEDFRSKRNENSFRDTPLYWHYKMQGMQRQAYGDGFYNNQILGPVKNWLDSFNKNLYQHFDSSGNSAIRIEKSGSSEPHSYKYRYYRKK